MDQDDAPLTTGQVATIFGVTTTTVKRWADDGRLAHFRTPGNHYRFALSDVEAFKASTSRPTTQAAS